MTKPQNSFKILTFPAGTLHCKSNDYIVGAGVYGTTKYPNELLNDLIIENGKNANEVSFRNRFIWLQNTLNEQIKKGTVFNLSKSLVISYKRKEYDPEVPPNFIDDSVAVSTTEEAGKNLIDILGYKGFYYPKPVSLIKYLLGFRDASIILDFFAGSGTTLHATMQLNKEDGGHRQCILVTNNENKICEEVTYERNKRVIQGYVTPKGDFVEGLKANTLRYYRTKLLPRVETNQNRRALMAACTELLCIQQDLYAEQPSFAGRKLNPRKARYFVQGKRKMLVIYDEQTVDTFAELLREMEVEERIRIYLFSFNGYPYTDNFMEVLDKVELCALPQAIYNVYKRVLPKAADPANEEEEMA